MSGGLIELVAYGAQDVYLTGNPQITFFKVTYQRHTNFSQECIEQTFSGNVSPGQRATCIVSRSGDLVGPMHLEVSLPSLVASTSLGGSISYVSITRNPSVGIAGAQVANTDGSVWNFVWVPWVGYRLIQSVQLEIGGQRIDKHYSKYFYMWHELSTSANKDAGLKDMVGGHDFGASDISIINNALVPKTLFVPLIFWFNTHPGLALPLIALQYHEVKLIFEFAPLTDLIAVVGLISDGLVIPIIDETDVWPISSARVLLAGNGSTPDLKIRLFADYYFLDTEERRRFAQLAHEYLIKQVQEITPTQVASNASTVNVSYRGLNHPVIFTVWGLQNRTVTETFNDWVNFTNSNPFDEGNGDDVFATHKLVLNGNDRYPERDVGYFNLVQPYNHFPSIPPKGINVFSHALQPAEHQPSGTLNYSRIDNSTNIMKYPDNPTDLRGNSPGGDDLIGTPTTWDFVGYAVNYNVLRIMSGMGGLAYSN